jgi:hypothetical protein
MVVERAHRGLFGSRNVSDYSIASQVAIPVGDEMLRRHAAALFGSLESRLLDRIPAIQAATAFAFADVLGKFLDANLGDVATLSTMTLTAAICLRKRGELPLALSSESPLDW